MNSHRVLVLALLDYENHEEGNDSCAGIYHQLPGLGIAEKKGRLLPKQLR